MISFCCHHRSVYRVFKLIKKDGLFFAKDTVSASVWHTFIDVPENMEKFINEGLTAEELSELDIPIFNKILLKEACE